MSITLSEDQLRFLRLHAQQLIPRRHGEMVGVAQVVLENVQAAWQQAGEKRDEKSAAQLHMNYVYGFSS